MKMPVLVLALSLMLTGMSVALAVSDDAAAPVAAGGTVSHEAPPVSPHRSLLDVIIGHPIVSVFVIIGLGLLIGRVRVYGVSLGTSGVIFAAIAFGALGASLPKELGNFGLVLFVYCVGLGAGPGFFRAFARHGVSFAKLSIVLVGTGALLVVLMAWLLGVPASLAAGVFTGALTSTPGLASALSALHDDPAVSIAYGIAYPYGVIGIVLFVQILPRVLGCDLEAESRKHEANPARRRIHRALIEVQNPNVVGRRIHEVLFIGGSHCQISRVLMGDRLVPVNSETVFETGQHVLAVGEEDRLQDIIDFLGKRSDHRFFVDTASEFMQVVVTSTNVIGKTLRQLNLINKFGVTISRVIRNDVGFVPGPDAVIQRADVLYAVGEPASLKDFAEFAGHRARVLDETDLISLSVGIVAGVLLGMTPIALPGTKAVTLGLAGGPLLVALVLAHFGGIGRVRGHMPRAARLLLMECGLVFFLASAGSKAGHDFIPVLMSHGIQLVLMAVVVKTAALTVGYLFAARVLKLNILEALGGICGGMTSTPGLGALTSRVDSEVSTMSYATAYPVALILMTVFAQVVVALLT